MYRLFVKKGILLYVTFLLATFNCFGAAVSSTCKRKPTESIAGEALGSSSVATLPSTQDVAVAMPATERVYKTPPANWLYQLPDDILYSIREMLMGDAWCVLQELIPHTLSSSLASRVGSGFVPLVSLFSHTVALNKNNIHHETLGLLSIQRHTDDDNDVTTYTVLLKSSSSTLSYQVNNAHAVHKAYFSPDFDTIIVEYDDISGTKQWRILDPRSLTPRPLCLWAAPDKEAIKLFFEKRTDMVTELQGSPIAISYDKRYVASKVDSNGENLGICIVDLATQKVLIPLNPHNAYRQGHSLPFYRFSNPVDESFMLINYGICLSIFDDTKQARIARYDLPVPCTIQGFVDEKTLTKCVPIQQTTTEEQRKKNILITTDERSMLLMPKKPHNMTCLMLEGVLSGAVDRVQKKDSSDQKQPSTMTKTAHNELALCVQAVSALQSMVEEPLLANFKRCFPSLAQRYAKSYLLLKRRIEPKVSSHVSLENLNEALELISRNPDVNLATTIKARLKGHYQERNAEFCDGRQVQQDIRNRFKPFNEPLFAPFLRECIGEICTSHTSIPLIKVTHITVIKDLQDLCVHPHNDLLEDALQEWLINYYRDRAKKLSLHSMQEIREHLFSRYPCCRELPPIIVQRWLYCIKNNLRLPEMYVSLESMERDWCWAEKLNATNADTKSMKIEIRDQIRTLLIQYCDKRRHLYRHRLDVIDDLEATIPLYTRLSHKQKEFIRSSIYYAAKPSILPFVVADATTMVHAFNVAQITTDDDLKTELMDGVCRFIVQHYKDNHSDYQDMIAVAEDIHVHLPLFVDTDCYRTTLRTLFNSSSIPKIIITQETINRALTIAQQYHHTGTFFNKVLRALSAVPAHEGQPIPDQFIINALKPVVLRYYQQESFNTYDQTTIIEDIKQSFPAFNDLTQKDQHELLSYVTSNMAFPVLSTRTRLRNACKVAGGGPRSVALATALYDRRKPLACAGAAVAIVLLLIKK